MVSASLLYRGLWLAGLGWISSQLCAQPLAAHKGLWFALMQDGQGRILASGERGRILWSDSPYDQWSLVQTPSQQGLTGICVAQQQYWAISQAGELLMSEDRGKHWQLQWTDEGPLFALACQGEQVVAVGAYGRLVSRVDGGFQARLLTELEDPELGIPHLYQIAVQGQSWWLAGEAGLVAESVDQGKTWRKHWSAYQGSWFALAVQDSSLWLAGLKGHLYQRSQGRWQPVAASPKTSIFSLKWQDKKLWMAGASGQIWRESQLLDTRYPGVINDLLPLSSGVWIAGDQGLVYERLP